MYVMRYYRPSLGRFNSGNALADHSNQIHLTPYNYIWNNPIYLVDPAGLMAIEPPDEENLKQEKRNIKIGDLPKGESVEDFLKKPIKFLNDGDEISGKEVNKLIFREPTKPDSERDAGEKALGNIIYGVENVVVDKSQDGKSATFTILAKEGSEKLNEKIPTDKVDVKLSLKRGKSGIVLTDTGNDGVKLQTKSISVSVGIIPLPINLAKTTIKGNELKSVKFAGISLVKEQPLGLPREFKKIKNYEKHNNSVSHNSDI